MRDRSGAAAHAVGPTLTSGVGTVLAARAGRCLLVTGWLTLAAAPLWQVALSVLAAALVLLPRAGR